MHLPRNVILELAQLCDGWSIFKPQKLIELGLPESIARELTRVHISDLTNSKYTIFVDDRPVDRLVGVYALDLLQWLAKHTTVDLKTVTAYGRGFYAERCKALIETKLGEPPTSDA